MRIVIIGGGNVAEALVRGFTAAGVPPVQQWTRKTGGELAKADLYLIAVSDKAIRALKFDFGDGVAAHTAGGVSMDALQARRRAVFYPLQTFTKGRAVDWKTVPILLEASDEGAMKIVEKAAELLSGDVRQVNGAQRMMLHAAGVFANNFANHMYAAGEELAREAGFDFEILKPLIRETAEKALASSSPHLVQTGPAVRNDFETRSKHAELLSQKPYLRNLYITISKNIWETSKKT